MDWLTASNSLFLGSKTTKVTSESWKDLKNVLSSQYGVKEQKRDNSLRFLFSNTLSETIITRQGQPSITVITYIINWCPRVQRRLIFSNASSTSAPIFYTAAVYAGTSLPEWEPRLASRSIDDSATCMFVDLICWLVNKNVHQFGSSEFYLLLSPTAGSNCSPPNSDSPIHRHCHSSQWATDGLKGVGYMGVEQT